VSAPEAVELGVALVHVPRERLLDETLALARSVAGAPLEALMAAKRLMLATRNPEVSAAREREDAAFAELLGSAANRAALDRFADTGRLA